MRPYTVRYTKPESLREAGYEKLIAVPFVLDGRPGYHRAASQYLIDRALGIWSPRAASGSGTAMAPTRQTLDTYAHWVANFLDWADRRGVSPENCNYAEHVHGRYQTELVKGTWSRDATGLRATTVNSYVQQACDFLSWMVFKGKREPFYIPTTKLVTGHGSATNSQGHRGVEVEVRQGKVREPKRRLRMPTDEEVRIWLSSVHARRGETLGLMAETVLLTALRRSEVISLRNDTLPSDPADWHISNPTAARQDQQVLVSIKYGAKGPSGGEDHGDKIGPERFINLPLHLAIKLHSYRDKVRPGHLQKWVGRVRGASAQKQRRDDAVHLFLDENTGHRVESWQFYAAWKSGDMPYPGWSPHLGRDWWACSTLWREVKLHEHVLKLGRNAPGALLAAVATDIIRLRIQPQLGHKRESTCFIYLQWVADMVGIALPEQYQRYLDELEIDEEQAERNR